MEGIAERPKYILPLIVFSQFAGTSLWFAGNAVVEDLQLGFGFASNAIGDITSAVQLGFIFGTLTFASLAVSDRFSPRKVFFVCSVLGSLTNLGMFLAGDLQSVLGLRFATGFFWQ
jgi:predicted MFS family arabinose efflux permease